MSILFKTTKITLPGAGADSKPYYIARSANKQRINLDKISASIASKSTLNKADVYGVIVSLCEEIPELLLNNYSVELHDLGTFSLHISSKAEESPDAVSKSSIKSVKVAFRPGKEIKKLLKMATFKAV